MAILGYDTKGAAGAGSLASGIQNASKFTLASGATLTELHGWFGGSSANVIVAIYSDVAGVPTTRLAYTSPLALTGADVDLSQSGFSLSLAAGDYWLSAVSSGAASCYREQTGGTSAAVATGAAFNPPATPYPAYSAGARKYSLWGVVGAAAGPSFVPQIVIT